MRKQTILAGILILSFLMISITGTSVTFDVYPNLGTKIEFKELAASSTFTKTINATNYELLVNTDNTSIIIQPANVTNPQALFDCFVEVMVYNATGALMASEEIDILAPTNVMLKLERGAYDIIYVLEGITNDINEPCNAQFDIDITQTPELCTQHFGIAHGYNPANGTLLTVLNTNYSCITDNNGFCNISIPQGAMYIAHAENVSDKHFWTCEETMVLLRWT